MAWVAFLQLPRLVRREAFGAQGHGLVNPHALANDGGFTNHDARPVVDEEAAANLRAGVDVDTGGRVGNFGTDARQQRQTRTVQVVRQTVMNHRQNPRIAQQHFVHTARCRIAVIGRQHVGVEHAAQARQGQGKILNQ